MKDNNTKEKFLELRANGLSYDKISKELNVSKQTLISWSQQFKHELSNLKAIELDRLQQEYYISKIKRIKLFGDTLEQINQLLMKRNLDELSTEKLIDYKIKIINTLKEDESDIVFKREETYNITDDLITFEKQKIIEWEA